MLRTVVFGSGLVALVPVVKAATPTEAKSGGPAKPPPMRPSELPIYESPHADYAEFTETKSKPELGYLRSALLEPVRAVRSTAQTAWEHTSALQHNVSDSLGELQDRTDWIVKYLREEENKEMRYGAVAIGGLTGFIFGLRGGIIRRLFYTGVGTVAMGAVCFPEETRELSRTNGALVKQYANIAYNFLYGVKPGDPQLELKFPELSVPKDFSQFVDMTSSLAVTVRQAILPPPKEVKDKPAEK